MANGMALRGAAVLPRCACDSGLRAHHALSALVLIEWHCSKDDVYVAVGSQDGSVFVFDASSGKMESKLSGSHKLAVTSVAWSPRGDLLASASVDKTVVLWRS